MLIEDLTPRYDEFTYISYQQLAEPQYDLTVMAKEKKLAYHEANFAKFCEFYSKK